MVPIVQPKPNASDLETGMSAPPNADAPTGANAIAVINPIVQFRIYSALLGPKRRTAFCRPQVAELRRGAM